MYVLISVLILPSLLCLAATLRLVGIIQMSEYKKSISAFTLEKHKITCIYTIQIKH